MSLVQITKDKDRDKAMCDAELSRTEWYEERAAILEYEAGLSRKEAERRAWQMMLAQA